MSHRIVWSVSHRIVQRDTCVCGCVGAGGSVRIGVGDVGVNV